MIKLSRFLSVPIVLAVCLGLTVVPAALPGGVVSASNNVTIGVQPATTNVNFSEAFSITVEVDNPNAMPISTVAARLDFNNTYFNVTSITAGTTLNTVLLNTYDNATGTIDYDAGILGGNTTNTTILVCTINCLSKSVAGSSTVDFVYVGGPPPRKTAVEYGSTHYLENGNTSLMNSGTLVVVVSDVFNLTVTSDGCCPITVGTLGTVAANSNDTFIVPCPSVTLTANDTASACSFTNWTVDGGAPTTNKSVIVTGGPNSSHTAVARCTVVATATLEGNVTFLGRGAAGSNKWIEGLVVRFFQGGSEMGWSPKNATTNNTGVFTIPGIEPGTYNISIKNSTCLCKLEPNVMLTAGNTVVDFGTTREGDCNDDNWVTLEDRSLLYAGWDTTNVIQGGHYCDLNRDGWLTLEDRSLMYANWDQGGD